MCNDIIIYKLFIFNVISLCLMFLCFRLCSVFLTFCFKLFCAKCIILVIRELDVERAKAIQAKKRENMSGINIRIQIDLSEVFQYQYHTILNAI